MILWWFDSSTGRSPFITHYNVYIHTFWHYGGSWYTNNTYSLLSVVPRSGVCCDFFSLWSSLNRFLQSCPVPFHQNPRSNPDRAAIRSFRTSSARLPSCRSCRASSTQGMMGKWYGIIKVTNGSRFKCSLFTCGPVEGVTVALCLSLCCQHPRPYRRSRLQCGRRDETRGEEPGRGGRGQHGEPGTWDEEYGLGVLRALRTQSWLYSECWSGGRGPRWVWNHWRTSGEYLKLIESVEH